MRLMLTFVAALVITATASGYGLIAHPKNDTREATHASQLKNLKYARYLCHHGANQPKRWGCAAVVWLKREASETAPPTVDVGYWASKQIAAAEIIGSASHRAGGDPWPHCPDPYDGGGNWQDTLNCENSGNWLDSPGHFRCGLQFEPAWERRFGQLCP